MTSLRPILAVIFDLGGVLIEVRSMNTPRQWAAACGADPDEVERMFRTDTEYRRLQTGEITLEQYHRHIVERIGRPMSYEHFAHAWCNVFGPILPGMEALLARLDGGPRLICLSNTDAWHAEVWRPKYAAMLSRFERVFISSEMGTRKPEADCYQQVLDYLDLPAPQVAFIDDKAENVQAAEQLGLRGIVAANAEQIARDLVSLGVNMAD